jgi:3-oxoadipate enol-lactonase
MERVNGIHIHVAVEGPERGPALVFANSLGTDFRIWDPLLPHLPAGLRVLRYDKRGHGLSDAPPAPYRMADHVGDLAGLLDVLGVPSAVVIGLSIGGLIAQGLAAAHPERVRGLVLMDTAHKIGSAEFWKARIEAVQAGGVASIADTVMGIWFSPPFHAAHANDVVGWRNMLSRTPIDGYLGSCMAIRDTDYETEARTIRAPTLFLCGSLDRSTPPETVKATAGLIPGARFVLIEGAGHIPCVETPAEVARHVGGFLKEQGLV